MVDLASLAFAPKYTVEVRDLADERSRISVYRSSDKKLIWRRTAITNCVGWTADGRTVAFFENEGSPWKTGYKLTTWHEGSSVKTFQIPPLPNIFGEGAFEDTLRIAPSGGHAVVMLSHTQGDFDIGNGSLLCLDLHTGRSAFIDIASIKFSWISNVEFEYVVTRYEDVSDSTTWRQETKRFNIERDSPRLPQFGFMERESSP